MIANIYIYCQGYNIVISILHKFRLKAQKTVNYVGDKISLLTDGKTEAERLNKWLKVER